MMGPIRHVILWTFVVATLLSSARDARAEVSPDEIQRSLDRARAYLYSKQKNGHWEVVEKPDANRKTHANVKADQWGGLTAIATYALLTSRRDDRQRPEIRQAIDFLMKADIIGTYALGMRAQVWTKLPKSNEVREAAKRDLKLLLDLMQNPKDPKHAHTRGFYHYTNLEPGTADLSNSNYGVLGVWACATVLGEVPVAYWQTVDEAWKRIQGRDGTWEYKLGKGQGPGGPITMTTAGVATLFITQDYLNQGRAANCAGNLTDNHIDLGVNWISKNFDQVFKSAWPLYALYNSERVGVAGGYKYFGGVNWFEQGAEWLLKNQDPRGCWIKDRHDRVEDVFGTAMAMLFLSRGRAPVVMNKLRYQFDGAGGPAPPWNQRHRDVANFTHYLGSMLESDLNWQIVNLDAPVEELLDAPLLYIAGNQALRFKAEHVSKLKSFVERGGLIVANADCPVVAAQSGGPFGNSIVTLCKEMFPLYEFRKLPDTHLIFNQPYPKARWRRVPAVMGLSNGARELVLLFPHDDPARDWQMRVVAGKPELHELAANIVLYAMPSQDLRVKGHTHLVNPDPRIKAARTIKVARLETEGWWDPEPAGWQRLGAIMHNTYGIDVAAEPVKPGQGKLNAQLYPVAHLTGTAKFVLKDAERDEIRRYVDGGGTLVIDAAGGEPAFAAAAQLELAAIFPDAQLPPPVLAPDHAIYTKGTAIDNVGYRDFFRRMMGRMRAPMVRGIARNGRVAVFVSQEDLSVGMMGSFVEGIRGYDTPTATAIMGNILLHASGHKVNEEDAAAIEDARNPNAPDPKVAQAIEQFAPGWRVAQCLKSPRETGVRNAKDKGQVFWLHPPTISIPAVLRTFVTIPPQADAKLKFAAGLNNNDWELVVMANGKEALRQPMNKETAKGGWADVEVDLSRFAGAKVRIELQAHAVGWSNEWALFTAPTVRIAGGAPATAPAK